MEEAPIDEWLQYRRASKALAINLEARQRLAARVITLTAVLAAFAALVQICDSLVGKRQLVECIRLSRDDSMVGQD